MGYIHSVSEFISIPSRYNPAITLESVIGKEHSASMKAQRWFGEGATDTIASNAYSLVVGSGLDLIASHLGPEGWLASRAQSMLWNATTGALYGKYRDTVFRLTRTTPESSAIKRVVVELGAFNLFQTPPYAGMVMLSTKLFEGGINWEKVQDGTMGFVALTPFIGPTFNWTYDKCREFFGFKTAAEKASVDSSASSAPTGMHPSTDQYFTEH